MKNKKGFTLLEVVISTAILGMVAVVILSLFSLQFKTIVNTRFITKDVYAAQQTMETTISDIQKALQSASDPGGSGDDYTLFDEVYSGAYERTVYGYTRTVELGDSDREFFIVVADYTRDVFEVPAITVTAEYSADGTFGSQVVDDDARSSLSVQSDYEITENADVWSVNVYRWYVSRPGFYTPLEGGATELEIGTMYPVFPDDYYIIAGATNSIFTSDLSNYAGRHLVCKATPANNLGKIGAEAISNPVYIPGLPVTDGLALHLDASLIPKDDATFVRVSGSDYFVRNWGDISGGGHPAVQSTTTRQPMLHNEKTGDFEFDDNIYESWVKYLRFDGSNDYLYTDSSIGTDGTIYLVARAAGAEDFTVYNNYDNLYYDYMLSFYSGDVYLGRDPNFDDDYSNCDIAEVIVYDSVLTESERDSVEDYLADKFTPVPPVISIYSLQSLSDTILKGQSYTMPTTVTAYYTDGHSGQVHVDWSPSAVDVNLPGRQEFEGTVAGTEKKASLTVTVVDATIVSLEDITVTVEQYSDYDMPSTVLAHLSNGSTMNVAVTWNPGSISTDTLGVFTSTGTSVLDNTKTMTLTVNVAGIMATGITVTPSTLSLGLGETATLTATVTPDNAYNKSVEWSSSDTSIATVDSSGHVTGVNYGTATVIARTLDGSNLSDTCVVNVATIELTGIGAISGTAKVGQTLTAGAVAPTGATVTYQWIKCSISGGTYTDISGATSSTYTLTGDDYNYYIKVMATGYGHYSGSVTSAPTSRVTACTLTGVSIIGTAQVGVTLTAELSPDGAMATYQWQRSYYGYYYSNIYGATDSTYTPTASDYDYSIRVIATGTNGYTGTVTSSPTYWVVACPLTSIGISGSAQVGETLTTVGTLLPAGATATYRWQRSTDGSNYSDISYATGSTYTLTSSDLDRYIRVRATGTGGYTGTVYSAAIGRATGVSVTGVTLNQSFVTLSRYRQPTITLTATVSPSNATNKNVTWTTSNDNIASISPSSGASITVTAERGGMATITVTTEEGDFEATCIIYVRPYATSISSVTNGFRLNFDSNISGNPYVTNSYGTILAYGTTGTSVTFTHTGGFSKGRYYVYVENSDGTESIVSVRKRNFGWYITSQT